mmetsp:Transcript_40989/g.117767  ORF Transcript_40989/g.117767 Transcript_40989/m.117767 type:complete len:201 (-) Transcript_40989:1092-1694(-)
MPQCHNAAAPIPQSAKNRAQRTTTSTEQEQQQQQNRNTLPMRPKHTARSWMHGGAPFHACLLALEAFGENPASGLGAPETVSPDPAETALESPIDEAKLPVLDDSLAFLRRPQHPRKQHPHMPRMAIDNPTANVMFIVSCRRREPKVVSALWPSSESKNLRCGLPPTECNNCCVRACLDEMCASVFFTSVALSRKATNSC